MVAYLNRFQYISFGSCVCRIFLCPQDWYLLQHFHCKKCIHISSICFSNLKCWKCQNVNKRPERNEKKKNGHNNIGKKEKKKCSEQKNWSVLQIYFNEKNKSVSELNLRKFHVRANKHIDVNVSGSSTRVPECYRRMRTSEEKVRVILPWRRVFVRNNKVASNCTLMPYSTLVHI